MSVFCFLPWEGSIVGRGLDPSAAARGLAALQAHRSPVARYDSYPQPGGINPPLRFSPVGGGVPDAPQVSSSQREGRRAACPQAAAAACVASQFHCAAFPQRVVCLTRAGRACPAPTISPPEGYSIRGFFLCRIVNDYTAFLFCGDCPNCCKSCVFDAKPTFCHTWLLDMLLKNGTINSYSYPPRTGEQKSRPRREKSEKRGKSDCSSP